MFYFVISNNGGVVSLICSLVLKKDLLLQNGRVESLRVFNLFPVSVFSRPKENKMCAWIMFEQGLIYATFLFVHIYLPAGDKK